MRSDVHGNFAVLGPFQRHIRVIVTENIDGYATADAFDFLREVFVPNFRCADLVHVIREIVQVRRQSVR